MSHCLPGLPPLRSPQQFSLQGFSLPLAVFLLGCPASLAPRPWPAPPPFAHLCLQVSPRQRVALPAPARGAPASGQLPGDASPAAGPGSGTERPAGPGQRSAGPGGGKVAGQGRGRGQAPPSHRGRRTDGPGRTPRGPWGPRSPCPERSHHPPGKKSWLLRVPISLFPLHLSSPPTRPAGAEGLEPCATLGARSPLGRTPGGSEARKWMRLIQCGAERAEEAASDPRQGPPRFLGAVSDRLSLPPHPPPPASSSFCNQAGERHSQQKGCWGVRDPGALVGLSGVESKV